MRNIGGVLINGFLSIAVLLPNFVSAQTTQPTERTFDLTYRAIVSKIPLDKSARIWLPIAQSNANQEVQIIDQHFPSQPAFTTEAKDQNRLAYLQTPPDANGSVQIEMTYRITRREVIGEAQLAFNADATLQADSRVPINGKPMTLLAGKDIPDDQFAVAKVLYDTVDDHMVYSKTKPGWGNGDANWACDSKSGNCTDFHSLFISLARSEKIPSMFEIGLPIPEKRGSGPVVGYHCWAWFKPAGHNWMPVDISEANKHPEMREYYFGRLTADRVAFTVGRDLILSPAQDGPPINFMIFPYVEIDGKQVASENVKTEISYRDAAPATQPSQSLAR